MSQETYILNLAPLLQGVLPQGLTLSFMLKFRFQLITLILFLRLIWNKSGTFPMCWVGFTWSLVPLTLGVLIQGCNLENFIFINNFSYPKSFYLKLYTYIEHEPRNLYTEFGTPSSRGFTPGAHVKFYVKISFSVNYSNSIFAINLKLVRYFPHVLRRVHMNFGAPFIRGFNAGVQLRKFYFH